MLEETEGLEKEIVGFWVEFQVIEYGCCVLGLAGVCAARA